MAQNKHNNLRSADRENKAVEMGRSGEIERGDAVSAVPSLFPTGHVLRLGRSMATVFWNTGELVIYRIGELKKL